MAEGRGTFTKDSGKIYEQAWCVNCGWSNANYKNALATAARHAQATGHEVQCEHLAEKLEKGEEE